MKVTFNVDSGANIHSCKSVTFDLDKEQDVKRFGYTKDDWLSMTDNEKEEAVHEWAYNRIEIFYEEEE